MLRNYNNIIIQRSLHIYCTNDLLRVIILLIHSLHKYYVTCNKLVLQLHYRRMYFVNVIMSSLHACNYSFITCIQHHNYIQYPAIIRKKYFDFNKIILHTKTAHKKYAIYIYIYIYIYIFFFKYISIHIYSNIYDNIYVYIYIRINIFISIPIQIYIHVCMCVCVYMSVCVCVCVCIHIIVVTGKQGIKFTCFSQQNSILCKLFNNGLISIQQTFRFLVKQ